MELWDVYDTDRNKTGRTAVRGVAAKKGDYRLVVHVCIFNSKGEMIIQQRQPFKSGFPNMWDITVGGGAVHGDTSSSAAQRELFEELGLKLNLSGTRPHLTVNWEAGFDDIYLIEKDIDLAELCLQYEEVQNVKWAGMDEILKMIDDGVFIPYHKSLFRLFFDRRKQYGCHQAK